jgi:hypothetical protein
LAGDITRHFDGTTDTASIKLLVKILLVKIGIFAAAVGGHPVPSLVNPRADLPDFHR